MPGKTKASILAAAVLSAMAVSQANAAFTYDLRLANGSHTQDITGAAPGTQYTLQLWGQISGYSTSATDQFIGGQYVNVGDTQGGSGGAITSSTMLGAPNTHTFSNTVVGSVGDFNTDGVQDWGSTNTATTTGWMQYVSASSTTLGTQTYAGYQMGNADAGFSEATASGGWEVLIATFTVTANSINSATGSTTFNVLSIPTSVKTGAVTSNSGLDYIQDASSTSQTAVSHTGTIGSGVTFTTSGVAIPEPASMGVLALGGLALLARRRKQA